MILHSNLRHDVHFIGIQANVLNIRLTPHSGTEFIKPLKKFLDTYTESSWQIIQNQEGGQQTHVEQKKSRDQQLIEEAFQQNVVQLILKEFPQSKISAHPREPS